MSSPMFSVSRAIAGAGASGISTGTLIVISYVLSIRKQTKVLGINMDIDQLGIALGRILGGIFTDYVSWR